ncbi:hypothetical protein D3C85_1353300 [compost metagenome]
MLSGTHGSDFTLNSGQNLVGPLGTGCCGCCALTPQKVAVAVATQAVHTVRGEHPQGIPKIIRGLDVLAYDLPQGFAELPAIAAQAVRYRFTSRNTGNAH